MKSGKNRVIRSIHDNGGGSIKKREAFMMNTSNSI